MKCRHCRRQAREIKRLKAFALQIAERLYGAASVLGMLAERKDKRKR